MEACKLMSGFLTRLSMREIEILDSIAEHTHCSFLDFLLPKITMLGNEGIFFILCAFVMLFFKKTRKTGIMMGVALLLGLIICNITIKPLVARTRPYDLIGVAPYLIKPESDYSFPQGIQRQALRAPSFFYTCTMTDGGLLSAYQLLSLLLLLLFHAFIFMYTTRQMCFLA